MRHFTSTSQLELYRAMVKLALVCASLLQVALLGGCHFATQAPRTELPIDDAQRVCIEESAAIWDIAVSQEIGDVWPEPNTRVVYEQFLDTLTADFGYGIKVLLQADNIAEFTGTSPIRDLPVDEVVFLRVDGDCIDLDDNGTMIIDLRNQEVTIDSETGEILALGPYIGQIEIRWRFDPGVGEHTAGVGVKQYDGLFKEYQWSFSIVE